MHFDIDGAIIEKAAAGDAGSFEKIVLIYEKTIYNVCFRFLSNNEDARDVAQEVFIKIFRNLKKYNFKCRFSTWAHRIAVNSCIDHLRKKKSEPRTEPLAEIGLRHSGISPAEAVISKDMLKNVGEAIGRLNEEYKSVIILRDVLGFSYGEISEITDTNPGTVKSRISRARNQLRLILINDYGIDGGDETAEKESSGLKEAAR